MSSLSQRGRHRKAQALPLPRMVRGQTGDPRGFQKVEAESENFKEKVEVAKEYCCYASSQGQRMEQGPLQHEKSGSPSSTRAGAFQQKASWNMLPRTALAGKSGQVRGMWLGRGALGLR